jgi:hypothetical protein
VRMPAQWVSGDELRTAGDRVSPLPSLSGSLSKAGTAAALDKSFPTGTGGANASTVQWAAVCAGAWSASCLARMAKAMAATRREVTAQNPHTVM